MIQVAFSVSKRGNAPRTTFRGGSPRRVQGQGSQGPVAGQFPSQRKHGGKVGSATAERIDSASGRASGRFDFSSRRRFGTFGSSPFFGRNHSCATFRPADFSPLGFPLLSDGTLNCRNIFTALIYSYIRWNEFDINETSQT